VGLHIEEIDSDVDDALGQSDSGMEEDIFGPLGTYPRPSDADIQQAVESLEKQRNELSVSRWALERAARSSVQMGVPQVVNEDVSLLVQTGRQLAEVEHRLRVIQSVVQREEEEKHAKSQVATLVAQLSDPTKLAKGEVAANFLQHAQLWCAMWTAGKPKEATQRAFFAAGKPKKSGALRVARRRMQKYILPSLQSVLHSPHQADEVHVTGGDDAGWRVALGHGDVVFLTAAGTWQVSRWKHK